MVTKTFEIGDLLKFPDPDDGIAIVLDTSDTSFYVRYAYSHIRHWIDYGDEVCKGIKKAKPCSVDIYERVKLEVEMRACQVTDEDIAAMSFVEREEAINRRLDAIFDSALRDHSGTYAVMRKQCIEAAALCITIANTIDRENGCKCQPAKL